jgi:transposase
MRKVREVLRLKYACGASVRTIARSVGIGHTTVAEYLRRTTVIGITWPVPAEIDDAELERRLFAPAGFNRPPPRIMPDWHHVHAELRRRGVTLLLLWEEYRAEQPDGYGYSRFCGLYIEWRRGVTATMRQTHVAGEKLFVDYAGDTVPVFDGATGEERRSHVFVAVLGASNYTYAEARWSEGLADWIGAHVNALGFIGGVPKLLVCDNLRAGVTAACRYEPGINRTYQDMATHYGTAVLPARVRRPRDKAKVETAVLIVSRFILARLRNRRFLSLGELNEAIRELLGDLNARLMRRLGASRREFFETIDRPALLPLPAEDARHRPFRATVRQTADSRPLGYAWYRSGLQSAWCRCALVMHGDQLPG